ncbi:MAG TPA: DUF3943 domain-containing protein [Burkholderiales bacterium]|nr:DUF3943 domain-containing protein [Burkholderiales bacterium]
MKAALALALACFASAAAAVDTSPAAEIALDGSTTLSTPDTRVPAGSAGQNYKLYPDLPSQWAALKELKEGPGPLKEGSAAPVSKPARPDLWSAGSTGKSYAIPALEIMGFDLLLNQFNRRYFDCCDYDTSLSSVRRNLRGRWVTDNDPYTVNQLGHPYQGSMYHGFARSAGLNYWESLGYTFAGSVFWEIAGETTPPSKNDQIASGIAGSFVGEALFRMSQLVLEQGGGMSPAWRELAAAAISPSTGFNRWAFGNRFDAIYDSRNAAYYSRLAVGVTHATQSDPGTSTKSKPTEAIVDFSLDYGLPGKPGYTYKRPFDYFSFQATASSANGFDSVLTRGLLFGTDYDVGRNYRGVWGLYGSYDYIAPQVFRISSTALSLGTTGQWLISKSLALQGTGMVGAGYASVGTINGVRDQDYHFGVAPQALLALRLIFGEKASLDLTAREYFVSDVAADRNGRGGHDNIARADLSFTVRVHKQHAVAVRYLWSRRDANYPVIGDRSQTRATLGIFYTLLGHDRFGAYDWRE